MLGFEVSGWNFRWGSGNIVGVLRRRCMIRCNSNKLIELFDRSMCWSPYKATLTPEMALSSVYGPPENQYTPSSFNLRSPALEDSLLQYYLEWNCPPDHRYRPTKKPRTHKIHSLLERKYLNL